MSYSELRAGMQTPVWAPRSTHRSEEGGRDHEEVSRSASWMCSSATDGGASLAGGGPCQIRMSVTWYVRVSPWMCGRWWC